MHGELGLYLFLSLIQSYENSVLSGLLWCSIGTTHFIVQHYVILQEHLLFIKLQNSLRLLIICQKQISTQEPVSTSNTNINCNQSLVQVKQKR